MLKELKFVQGAVARKDFIPALTHFRIEGGHVRSFNGTLALSSPISFDIDCTPKAQPFVKAIQNCNETVSLSMTATGRLRVQSGKFKAFIPCVEEETPHVKPEGDFFDIDGDALLAALKTVAPFIGNDASRPWSNGVLLKGQSAYATNNVVLVEYWTGSNFPFPINIPGLAVKEMLRIGEPPIAAQATDKSISFLYEDERWVRSALYETDWPDLTRILDVPANADTLDDEVFDALTVVKPFVDDMGRIYFTGHGITTSFGNDDGASYDIEGFTHEGVYQLEMLSLLKGRAQSIDFTLYPKPAIFYGERLRGAIIGMRA